MWKPFNHEIKYGSASAKRRTHTIKMLFALVPMGGLAEKNTTSFPVHGSEGTFICPMQNNCCFNPGEDADGNAVVWACSFNPETERWREG